MENPVFVAYALVLIVLGFVAYILLLRGYGEKHVVVPLTVTACLGSFTVLSVKVSRPAHPARDYRTCARYHFTVAVAAHADAPTGHTALCLHARVRSWSRSTPLWRLTSSSCCVALVCRCPSEQAASMLLKETFEGRNQFVYPLTYFVLAVLVSTAISQVRARGTGALPQLRNEAFRRNGGRAHFFRHVHHWRHSHRCYVLR